MNTCPDCKGTGVNVHNDACDSCAGSGLVDSNYNYDDHFFGV